MTLDDLKTLGIALVLGGLVIWGGPPACDVIVGGERNSERPGEMR